MNWQKDVVVQCTKRKFVEGKIHSRAITAIIADFMARMHYDRI